MRFLIDSYTFGKIGIDGLVYDKDVIFYRNHVLSPWRRKEGHLLRLEDLSAAIQDSECKRVIVGTGKFGFMKMAEDLIQYLSVRGTALTALRTDSAVLEFNRWLQNGENVLGAFHLTC
ncbi:MAG TPA: Mth938-like domain-containing protein [bacterium]